MMKTTLETLAVNMICILSINNIKLANV